jgi:hypothetical protein
MPGSPNLVQLTTVRGQPILAGDMRVTPESQALVVRLPFGGLVWHRPTAITVERAGRAVQRLPIVDLTRVAPLGLLLVTAVCLIGSSPPSTVIVVGPDGVQVKPIFDVTKFGLAVLTAWAAMLLSVLRMQRATKGR